VVQFVVDYIHISLEKLKNVAVAVMLCPLIQLGLVQASTQNRIRIKEKVGSGSVLALKTFMIRNTGQNPHGQNYEVQYRYLQFLKEIKGAHHK
jgi:hypothetical protein